MRIHLLTIWLLLSVPAAIAEPTRLGDTGKSKFNIELHHLFFRKDIKNFREDFLKDLGDLKREPILLNEATVNKWSQLAASSNVFKLALKEKHQSIEYQFGILTSNKSSSPKTPEYFPIELRGFVNHKKEFKFGFTTIIFDATTQWHSLGVNFDSSQEYGPYLVILKALPRKGS